MQSDAYNWRSVMRELVKLLKVLSDEPKLRVLNLIYERECCVCEVMQAMEISQSKASRTLSALYDVGLLKLRKEGRWALYSIDPEPNQTYVKDILKGIRSAISSNPVIQQDLERLKKAERIGPACVTGGCKEQLAARISEA
jgi:ArsR family transcriptional regulator, arsenate/arsenite/antimonite-responsive transcriptional repressor